MNLISKENRTNQETFAQEIIVTVSFTLEQLMDTRLNNVRDDFANWIGNEILDYIEDGRR